MLRKLPETFRRANGEAAPIGGKERMKTNLYQNLLVQANKLYRHNRQGSYRTRQRYYEAYQRFLRFAAKEFHLEKLSNCSGKHLSAYVEDMQKRGLSASTIKTDLAAIRFWHDQIPNAHYVLPGNEEFELERRQFGKMDRRWTDQELEAMLSLCLEEGQEDYWGSLILARYAGLRLHEVLRIDTAIARAALKTGFLTIKGKGGKIRNVPICEPVREALSKALKKTPSGQKLFVSKETPTHERKAAIQNFIRAHRGQVQKDGDRLPITFHGLRHTYAAEQYEKEMKDGTEGTLGGFQALGPRTGRCHPRVSGKCAEGATNAQTG